ncbi:MAG TPA: hypothetical protein VF677_09990 [Flavobacterium sp.]|jgi:predicted transcriptional regulator
MKQSLFALFATLIFIACENKKPGKPETIKPLVENKFYYVEFVDLEHSSLSQKTVALVKSRLFRKGYILGSSGQKTTDWPKVKETDTTSQVQLQNLDESHQSIHRFKDYSEYNPEDRDAIKVVITYNKPDGAIPNFSFRGYEKLGYPEWQPRFGTSFWLKKTKTFTEEELADWMVYEISGYTFK